MSTIEDIRTAITKKTKFTHDGDLDPSGSGENHVVDSFLYQVPSGEIIDLWIVRADKDGDDVTGLHLELWHESDQLEITLIGPGGFGYDSIPDTVVETVQEWTGQVDDPDYYDL